MPKVVASTFQQLDFVLTCIWYRGVEKHLTFKDIAEFLNNDLGDAVPFGHILSILKRLEKDGYVECDDRAVTHEHPENRVYRLTFDGRFWIENGGYHAEADRQNAESIRVGKIERAQRDFRRTQNVLLILVSLGTLMAGVYYLVELYWNHGWFRFGK